MDTIWLGHTVVDIDDCEDAWTLSDSDVTPGTSTTYYQKGTKSISLALAKNTGANTLLAYYNTGTISLTGCTHIAFWIMSTIARSAGDLKFHTDDSTNCASPVESIDLPALVANQWTACVLTCAGAPANIASIGLKQVVDNDNSCTIYIDDVIGLKAKQYTVRAVRGLDDPDDVIYWPPLTGTHLDGSSRETITGRRRMISIDFGALTTKADRVWLENYVFADDKRVMATNDMVEVVMSDATNLASTWLNDVSYFRAFSLRLIERNLRTTQPSSWSY